MKNLTEQQKTLLQEQQNLMKEQREAFKATLSAEQLAIVIETASVAAHFRIRQIGVCTGQRAASIAPEASRWIDTSFPAIVRFTQPKPDSAIS